MTVASDARTSSKNFVAETALRVRSVASEAKAARLTLSTDGDSRATLPGDTDGEERGGRMVERL
jgi:hypothetical protein